MGRPSQVTANWIVVAMICDARAGSETAWARPETDLYDMLGIRPAAFFEQDLLKAAYRRRALEAPLDKCTQTGRGEGECQEHFVKLTQAYDWLKAPAKAKVYHRQWEQARGRRGTVTAARSAWFSPGSASAKQRWRESVRSWNRFLEENKQRWEELVVFKIEVKEEINRISRKTREMQAEMQELLDQLDQIGRTTQAITSRASERQDKVQDVADDDTRK